MNCEKEIKIKKKNPEIRGKKISLLEVDNVAQKDDINKKKDVKI